MTFVATPRGPITIDSRLADEMAATGYVSSINGEQGAVELPVGGGDGVIPFEAGAWTTGHFFPLGAVSTHAGKRYECLIDHTSGVFATDLAALKWVLLGVDPASSVALPADAPGWLYDPGTGAYVWSTPTAADVGAVPAAGGTMTGLLTLSGAPTASLHAASKAYVDSAASGAAALPTGFRVMQPPTVTSGGIYLVGGIASGVTAILGGDTAAQLVPFMIDTPGTYYLGCSLTGTAASTGALLRFAIYTDVGLVPTTATDLGTVAATSTDATNGVAHFSPSTIALNSGQRYWAAVGSQGAATTQPTFRAVSVPAWTMPVLSGSAGFAYKIIVGTAGTAFASSPTVTGVSVTAPLFYLKAA